MNARSRQQVSLSNVIQPEHLPKYQAIEAAYLERGIRIRLSPTKAGQSSGRKSAGSNLQRHTAFANRNPSRTSSVLQYTSNNLEQQHDSRSFSVLQQSSEDFEPSHAHNVSYAQSSQINDESFYHDYVAASIVASEHSIPSPRPPPEKIAPANELISANTASFHTDPDFLYMSTLFMKPSGDAFRGNERNNPPFGDVCFF